MNDRRLVRLLADVRDVLARADAVLPARLADIDSASSAWPRSSLGSGGAGTVSDPVGVAAVGLDQAAVDRRRLEDALKSIGVQAGVVVGILATYTPRVASDRERRDSLPGSASDVGCRSCARLVSGRGHLAHPRWEPVARTVVLDGVSWPLCWWCFDWLRDTGALPSREVVAAHHSGARVRRPRSRRAVRPGA